MTRGEIESGSNQSGMIGETLQLNSEDGRGRPEYKVDSQLYMGPQKIFSADGQKMTKCEATSERVIMMDREN